MLHKDKIKEFYEEHKDGIATYNKQYRDCNAKKLKIRRLAYKKSPAGRLSIARDIAQRRLLGFIPINTKLFKIEHWHHLHLEDNINFTIALPSFIHRAISHSRNDDASLVSINAIAIQYWLDPEIFLDV